jgi:hypothetical protein
MFQTRSSISLGETYIKAFKGSLTQDFRLQVFFMNQFPRGPLSIPLSRFKLLQKFMDIRHFVFIAGINNTGDKINCRRCHCYWRSIVAGFSDTGDYTLSRILNSMTPAINLSPVTIPAMITPH